MVIPVGEGHVQRMLRLTKKRMAVLQKKYSRTFLLYRW
ncbi:hypothetical protein [Paraflavitalea speifideaquila]|nr:hypothetical protein [Paraflavitalea speifideiaquila]